jgi:arsenite-transporting ATPase
MDFEVVLFDTAPTGHTLRLLQFPSVIEKSLGKFLSLKTQFLPMFSQISPMLGLNDISMDTATKKLEETLQIVRQINSEFKDAVNMLAINLN